MDGQRRCLGVGGVVALAVTLLGGILPLSLAGQDGGVLYRGQCIACHSIGGGTILGPDLAGVHERRSEDWLIRFIQNSPAMIAAGDPEAVAVSEAFPGLAMPPWPLSDAEVRAILAYIAGESTGGGTASAAPALPPVQGDPALGARLFQGTRRFANGGSACNACHEVVQAGVLGGGGLAVDLTVAHSRLSDAGVRAILANPPFPVMQHAYRNRPLTGDEVAALAAFLQEVDAGGARAGRDWRLLLALTGVVGGLVLLGLYSLIWRGRRGGSVNHEIFARQVRST